MKTITNYPQTLKETVHTDFSFSELSRFSVWCNKLEPVRCFILAAFILFQGCIVVPALLLISSMIDIGLSGTSVVIAATGTVGVLVSNISEAPMKYVVGIFGLNLLVSIALIALHVVTLF